MPNKANEWKRKYGSVAWADVWAWAADLYGSHGYIVTVSLHPPTGTKNDPHGRVLVSVNRPLPGVGFVPYANKWADLPDPLKASAEATAMRLLLDIINGLQTVDEDAERAAKQATDRLW